MTGVFQIGLLASLAILVTGAIPLAQTRPAPSTETLVNPDGNGADWLLPAHSYSGNRQVVGSEIGPQNVDEMKVAWTSKLPGSDPVETAPIVWDSTVYVTSAQDDIFALNTEWRAQMAILP